jgi:hypothetical protein
MLLVLRGIQLKYSWYQYKQLMISIILIEMSYICT